MHRSVKLICSHDQRLRPHAELKYWVDSCMSSVNFVAMINAPRMMTSGKTESICCCELAESVRRCWADPFEVRGNDDRQLRENFHVNESKMHTASAMTSIGRSARINISWTIEIDGFMKEAPGGSILAR